MKINNIKRGFAMFRKSLNPEKHIYYSRHYTDHSESLYWPGRILQPKSVAARGPSADYIEQTTVALFSFLREKFPQTFTFQASDYDSIKNNSFYCYNVELFSHINDLANILASKVVVKDSRFRPSIEQKARVETVGFEYIFVNINLGQVTIQEFVENYAKSIEDLAALSINGRKLTGNLDASELEDMYGLNEANRLNLEKEHSNILNRLLNYIH